MHLLSQVYLLFCSTHVTLRTYNKYFSERTEMKDLDVKQGHCSLDQAIKTQKWYSKVSI